MITEILERGINSKTDLKGADAFFQNVKRNLMPKEV
jgi:hypothetical protein